MGQTEKEKNLSQNKIGAEESKNSTRTGPGFALEAGKIAQKSNARRDRATCWTEPMKSSSPDEHPVTTDKIRFRVGAMDEAVVEESVRACGFLPRQKS